MSSKPVINWREKHKQIKEWKKQKKLKLKHKTNGADNQSDLDQTEPPNVDNEVTEQTADQSMDQTIEEESSSGRKWTASIAVPSSIVDNAQSPELKAYLIGQIARALVIFQIDEIVVFDEYSKHISIE